MVSGFGIAIKCATAVLWMGVGLMFADDVGAWRRKNGSGVKKDDRFTRQEEICKNRKHGDRSQQRNEVSCQSGASWLGPSGALASFRLLWAVQSG